MSFAFLPNPIITGPACHAANEPDISASRPTERGGDQRPDVITLMTGATRAARWRRVAFFFRDYLGDAIVALALTVWIAWLDDVLLLLLRWTP